MDEHVVDVEISEEIARALKMVAAAGDDPAMLAALIADDVETFRRFLEASGEGESPIAAELLSRAEHYAAAGSAVRVAPRVPARSQGARPRLSDTSAPPLPPERVPVVLQRVRALEHGFPQGAADKAAFSVIAAGLTIVGDCEVRGSLRVEGVVEGVVLVGHDLIVARGGIISGAAVGYNVTVGGRVSGSVIAMNRLELQDASHVDGDIRARRLMISEGSRLAGRVTIGFADLDTDPEAAAVSQSSAASTAGVGGAARRGAGA